MINAILMCASLVNFAAADIVLEEDSNMGARVEDRATQREVMKAAPSAESNSVSTATVVVEGATPAAAPAQSKADRARNARILEEIRNEDLLTERLESQRRRDEEARMGRILKNFDGTEQKAEAPAAAPVIQQQVVTPTALDAAAKPESLQMTEAPKAVPQVQQAVVVAPEAQANQTSMQMTAAPSEKSEDETRLGIMPRGGVSTMSSNDYDIKSHFTAGVSLNVGVSDYLAFEAGYAYSEYGVKMGPGYVNAYGYNYGATSFSELLLKQNVFDLGLKLYFVGSDARLRPYVGGGGAYSMGYINYDKQTIEYMRSYNSGYTSDYELNSFLGYLSLGLDVKVSKSVSIGAAFKHYSVLSSNQNQAVNNSAFFGYNYATAYFDANKQALGGSLADSSFNSILVGATFTF